MGAVPQTNTNPNKTYEPPFRPQSETYAEYLARGGTPNKAFGPNPYEIRPPTPVLPPPAAVPAAAAPDPYALAHQNTLRTLELLRQMLGEGARSSTANLRSNLAQRGLLDSGSLGAGLGRISDYQASQLARGTLAAANSENDTLFRLMQGEKDREEKEKDRQLQKYLAERGYQAQIEAARAGRPAESNPWAAAAGTLGGAAISTLPFLL